MLRRLMMVVAVMVATLGFSRTALADTKEIKLGTLAPKDSAWGKVFGAWSKAVDEESKGAVKLTWFYNGSKGDEIAMVGKMRSKELDAAAITATGLAQIWPHIGALVMSKETYDSLPADAKAVLERTGKNTGKLLTDRIRAIDEAAFNRLKGSKTVVDLNDAEKAAWAATFTKVRSALKAEGKFRADVFDEVVAAAQ